MKKIIPILFLFTTLSGSLSGQAPPARPFLEPADTLNQPRFRTCVVFGTAVYAGASFGLYQLWYKNYGLTGFHTFNDLGEWNDMDKLGHTVTAYNESLLSYYGARWTGLSRNKSTALAAGVGMLLQGTVEIMDGFSEKWGFSWADVGFNTLGVGLFVGQELAWREQRIVLKLSNTRPEYPDFMVPADDGSPPVSLQKRAKELYGSSYAEAFLKDYNGQALWASFNLASFSGQHKPDWLPGWLNLAIGYGSENMFGGFSNSWQDENGATYTLDDKAFPRYRQFYLSLDVDLRRIPTRKRGLRFLLGALNWVKIPAPALEINTAGGVKFRPLFW
ncbi:MAG: DUF2279 domain-containing protein [Lewinellaceae bacterium]|nr:DUF2279 domain-containing protein [Phaeodactylibacter sp.]MCB9035016.1 DUF2279 domain-containing protein [Lewinellaceae bacterium]